MFDCKPCNKRVASWQDGTEWKPPQARCEQCGLPVEETDRRRGNVITSTYTCDNCDHHHKSTMKLITSALADTNWQLMSDGVHHRLGYLSGRLRAYESDEELHKLVQKQVKAGTRKPAATKPAPTTEAPESAEPTPAPKRTRRGKQRAIRVRGVLHSNLHILIPPGEPTKPPPKTSKKK